MFRAPKLSIFKNLNFKLVQQKMRKNAKIWNNLGSKTAKTDILTLNYDLPSTLTTLST